MPNYRKYRQAQKNKRNKNKNKNSSQQNKNESNADTSSSAKQELSGDECESVGTEPSVAGGSATSPREKGVIDDSSLSSNEEIDESACNVDIAACSSDSKTVLTKSSFSCSSKESTEIERISKRIVFGGDSLVDASAVISDSFDGVSGINSTKTGTPYSKDAAATTAATSTSKSVKKSKKWQETSAENEDHPTPGTTSRVLLHSTVEETTERTQEHDPDHNASTRKVIVHQISKESPTAAPGSPASADVSKVFVHKVEESRTTTHTALKTDTIQSTQTQKTSKKKAVRSTTREIDQSGKVIIHQISREDESASQSPREDTNNANAVQTSKVIVHQISKEDDHIQTQVSEVIVQQSDTQQNDKVIEHQVSKENKENSRTKSGTEQTSKVIVHQISTENEDSSRTTSDTEFASKVIWNSEGSSEIRMQQVSEEKSRDSNIQPDTEHVSKVIVHHISTENDKTRVTSDAEIRKHQVMQDLGSVANSETSPGMKTQQVSQEHSRDSTIQPDTEQTPKVILHQISTENEDSSRATSDTEFASKVIRNTKGSSEIKTQLVSDEKSWDSNIQPGTEQTSKVIVHQISIENEETSNSPKVVGRKIMKEGEGMKSKPVQDLTESVTFSRDLPTEEVKVIAHQITLEDAGQVVDDSLKDVVPVDDRVSETPRVIHHQIESAESVIQSSDRPSTAPQSPMRSAGESSKQTEEALHRVSESSSEGSHDKSTTQSFPMSFPVQEEPQPLDVVFERISRSRSPELEKFTKEQEHSPCTKIIVHPILQDKETQISPPDSPQIKAEHTILTNGLGHQPHPQADSKKDTSFPVYRSPKVIVHQIHHEGPAKPAFPLTANSMERLNNSSKKIACKILQDVSSELKTTFASEVRDRTVTESPPEPIRTSFPLSALRDGQIRTSFSDFNTLLAESATTASASSPKVIIHPILRQDVYKPEASVSKELIAQNELKQSESVTESSQCSAESRVIVHQISQEDEATTNSGYKQTTFRDEGVSKPEQSTPESPGSRVIVHKIVREESNSTDVTSNKFPHRATASSDSDSKSNGFPEAKIHPTPAPALSDLEEKLRVFKTLQEELKLSAQLQQRVQSSLGIQSDKVAPNSFPVSNPKTPSKENASPKHPLTPDESTSSSSSSGDTILTAIRLQSPNPVSPSDSGEQQPSVKNKSPRSSFFLTSVELSQPPTPPRTDTPDSSDTETLHGESDIPADESPDTKDFLKVDQIPKADVPKEPAKVIIHPILREMTTDKPLAYRVESPQPEQRLAVVKKSKSFDDDDVVIQEMSDTSSAGDTDNPPVVSEAESETDTLEAIDDFPETLLSSRVLSVQTLPIDHEDDSQSQLSPKSSQNYKARRQQNRAALESHFLPQFLSPIYLDSIKEENSDLSDSERRSECSDRADHPQNSGDLEDDVFHEGGLHAKKADAVFPKSNLDFSKKHIHVHTNVRPPKTSAIREEAPPPSVVEAKIIDQGSVEESCSTWSTDVTPESEAAEVVYIDSASSSVSDLLELDYSQGQPHESEDSLDVRIQTPTIDLESINEMFPSRPHTQHVDPPSPSPPPSPTLPPVKENENFTEKILPPPPTACTSDPATITTLSETKSTKTTHSTVERTISNEIILEKIETMSATVSVNDDDRDRNDDRAAAAAASDRTQNSKADNPNSCDSAINEVVANATPDSAAVGTSEKMENIREIVSSAVKSDLGTAVDQAMSKPDFKIESDTAGLASSENSSPITTGTNKPLAKTESPPIKKLRSLCTEALASMPYGEEVLQELATVAKNIGDMPYPLPEIPHIHDIQLSLRSAQSEPQTPSPSVITLTQVPPLSTNNAAAQKLRSPPPPPVPEPPSKYESWLGVPTESDPNVLVCLSPSQRAAVKDTTTPDSLLDMHKKFVERRGYHEFTSQQVKAMNDEHVYETVTLRKSSSPPPPLPPRPQHSSPPAQKPPQSNGNGTESEADIFADDQNNHRLLAIIRDAQPHQHHDQQATTTTTSENISRRTESVAHTNTTTATASTTPAAGEGGRQEESAKQPSVSKQTQERFVSESSQSTSAREKMQTEHTIKVDSEPVMGLRFPTSEYFDSIFSGSGAGGNKRFSNIETGPSASFCSQLRNGQPKRYSNIETSTFESRKCVENGKVLYDVTDRAHEKFVEGEKPDSMPSLTSFPQSMTTNATKAFNSFPFNAGFPAEADSRTQQTSDTENIMSAFKLKTQTEAAFTPAPPPPPPSTNRVEASPPAPPVPPLPVNLAEATAATASTTKSTSTSESVINRNFNAEIKETIRDDFRQRAKELAGQPQSAGNTTTTTTSTSKSSVFDHDKVFKEFDELSKLLKDELESGKRRPPATLDTTQIPASVSDYNRVAAESRIQSNHVTSSTSEQTRRAQMKKLAEEIDRTAEQRQRHRQAMRIPIRVEKPTPTPPKYQPEPPTASHEQMSRSTENFKKWSHEADRVSQRTYEIPVQVEKEARPRLQNQRSYEIPVHVEPRTEARQRTFSERRPSNETPTRPVERAREESQRFRRAESMFNISDTSTQRHMLQDDWLKYVGDLGSSENICKPFQREVEICYLGRRPNIRAPRLSASTSDLSSSQCYDTYGAYDVRRSTHNQTPRPQQPPRRFLSTQSMIDTTPITPCVSSRRSPVPERRSSLPRELHDQQLKYISSREQQLQLEFERLENERRQLIDEMNRAQINQRISREAYRQRQLPPLTEDESFRQQMAEEWLDKVAQREERRLQKIIKISKLNQDENFPAAPPRRTSASDIGDEFLRRVKERRSKLCMPSDSDWESGAESQPAPRADGNRSETEEPPVTILEGHSAADLKQLPKHLREFAKLTSQLKEEHREETTENTSCSATKKSSIVTTVKTTNSHHQATKEPQPQPQPQHQSQPQSQSTQQDVAARARDLEQLSQGKRQKVATILRNRKPAESGGSDGSCPTATGCAAATKRRKQTRFLLTPNRRSWSESDLLREIDKDLVLAKGFLYANVFSVKNEYMSEPETEYEKPKKMAQLSRRQYDGIGPTTNDGMPVVLRSEVKEPNQHEWYKRIFQTIHKQKNPDDYVTIRYKCPRGRYAYKANGYMSEPEPNYDSDYSTVKYRTLERRRLQSTGPAPEAAPSAAVDETDTVYGTMPNPVKSGQGSYKVQPGRIEDYVTGHSSVSEKEKKEHLDQQKLSPHYTQGNLSRALLKEQGYTSDSNLVFRKKDAPQLQSPLSPVEQKQVYKSVQAGGQPPLLGFRKPAPEKPKESPNRYFESDVNIHYKTPIRYENKEPIPEEELAIRQAELMQKLYQEERRRKYLQELQDMNSRRHTDNFTPSQKSPIPLNRYDDFNSDLAPKSPNSSNFPRTVARALYNFQGQTARELTFKRGDVIYIRRQIDKNWYEGEHNAMIGLLPSNYVEIITKDGVRQPPKKPSEGQARAKYNFQAQSGIELSLNKGELVTLTRRVDENWFEGKIANRKGIFPVSYVEVLVDIGAEDKLSRTPITQSIITQTSSVRPSLDTLRTNINNEFNSLTSNGQHPNGILKETRTLHKTEVLHVDTNTEPVAYRALYKYRPQNTDELELQEGDIVYVLEKCDDGWFVGTSQRSGCFGTFPGNYVERV